MLRRTLREITPPVVWRAVKRLLGRPPEISYQGVNTQNNLDALYGGRFAEAFEKYKPLDPFVPANEIRLRLYNICHFAQYAKRAPGDFAFVGVSFGVTARVVYEYLNLQSCNCSIHLVDPFTGIDDSEHRAKEPHYNTDIDFVRKQYSPEARVVIQSVEIPDGLPLKGLERLAFVHMDTGDSRSEVAALPYLYEHLSPGGVIVIDQYCLAPGFQNHYAETLASLGVTPFCMVTGQGVIMKP